MAQDWDIRARADVCTACRRAFADREACFSVLMFGAEGYARQDFCEPCWDTRRAEGGAAYSAWRGVFRAPPPPAEEPLRKENAETLLRKLMEDPDPARAAVIYILAVMLERKKILIERDVHRHGDTLTRTYEHKTTGEAFLVTDPRLRLDQLEPVQAEVIALLEGRMPGTPAPNGAETAASAPGDAKNADGNPSAL